MNRKRIMTIGMAVCAVLFMMGAYCLLGDREIIFPEMAAIAAGLFLAPRLPWETDLKRILLFLAIGAVTGMLIVRLIPLPLMLQMMLAFLIASLLLLISQTGFAPMISAVVLPVMLQSRSVVYPVSAVLLTATVLGMRLLAERFGYVEKHAFTPLPKPSKQDQADMLLCWVCGSAVIAAACISGVKLLAAPPLLVAFTEFRKPETLEKLHPAKAVLLIGCCAAVGTGCLSLSVYGGLPVFVTASAAMLMTACIMRKIGIYLPPAAALTILVFLVSKDGVMWTYPLQIIIGTILMIAAARMHILIIRFMENRKLNTQHS